MRKLLLPAVMLLSLAVGYTQEVRVELVGRFEDIKFKVMEPMMITPSGFWVDEKRQRIIIDDEIDYQRFEIEWGGEKVRLLKEELKKICWWMGGDVYPIGEYTFGVRNGSVQVRDAHYNRIVCFSSADGEALHGLLPLGPVFFLKGKDRFYSVFPWKNGSAGSVDTDGRIYMGKEVIELLRALDPEKYEASVRRAEELGLREAFEEGRALVWGRTYYDTPERLHEYWGEWLFRSEADPIYADEQGNLYQLYLNFEEDVGSEFAVVGPDGEYLVRVEHVAKGSEILGREYRAEGVMRPPYLVYGVYVGFGGNVYFYVAGYEYTEVFRIRRTWGEPSIYALAVNGYTDDWYGEYVDGVLEKMSDEELRLLRNCVFALYGYVFKDESLREYFSEQVWYEPDPGVDPGRLELPPERRRLVERVVQEERKRGLRK
ncbi:YARHG domain-containing protein [Spirochaeta thermophila]|uniref:YARHG domain-containing protein n=1 Tax=Winmispira thermophila (strain ATCC 49972 / DSM 6192 / RI 19.B1) TaxID=665571 RepID=E0RQF3_WINT6|nr:YARHG domain-containing protein [Spirochaeta thermophila]ADN02929.1 hypothetical protein STHERM_c19940 [Spirochaeta thermophila DSM 6192]